MAWNVKAIGATVITFDLSVKNVYMYFFRESWTSHITTIFCFPSMSWSWTTFSVHAEVISIKSCNEINGKLGFTFSSPPRKVNSELCRRNTFYILPTIVYDIKCSVSFHNWKYGGNERRSFQTILATYTTFWDRLYSPNVEGCLQKWPTISNPMPCHRPGEICAENRFSSSYYLILWRVGKRILSFPGELSNELRYVSLKLSEAKLLLLTVDVRCDVCLLSR